MSKIEIDAIYLKQALVFIKQALDKPENKAASALGLIWLKTLEGYLPIICQCGRVITTTAGGEADSGIYCTECKAVFCDNCYDTSNGDGCHCHKKTS